MAKRRIQDNDGFPTAVWDVNMADPRDADVAASEELMREKTHNSIREDYFRDKLGIKTERERIAESNQQARLEQIQAKAEFDAANFEKRYTAKQKSEISRLSAMEVELDSNPNFSDQEKIAAKRAIQMKKMGIQPTDLPRLSPYPDGQGVGDVWKHPTGGTVTRLPDGRVSPWAGWKDSPESNAIKDQHEILKQQLKSNEELQKQFLKEAIEGEIESGSDKDGNPKTRKRTPQEVRAYMREIFPENQAFAEGDEEGRARVSQMRQDAGMPSQPTGGVAEAAQAAAPQEDADGNLQAASAIIAEALANPEKMKDPAFAAQARQARDYKAKYAKPKQ
jgi:hypothetical protein